MDRKYCLKLDGRFAGHYEIFSEKEILWLRDWLLHLKKYALTDDVEVIIDKLSKVVELRTVDE